MGDPNAMTPNLDRLAADGVTFTRAVSNCPWCTPTTLGLCGLPQPDWMRGFDYSGARRHGGTSLERAPESAFLQYCLHDSPFLEWVWRGVITADGWKYVALEGQPFAMFDLNRDPYELENLAFRRAFLAQRRRLRGLLARWIADTGDRFTLAQT